MNSIALQGVNVFQLRPHVHVRRRNTKVFKPNLADFACPSRRLHILCPWKTPDFEVIRCSMLEGRVLELEDAALLVSTCITRILPPTLTLDQGLEKIEEAIAELKENPPSSAFGLLRFQVAVPPSPKSLSWFCCQPETSAVFPVFFLSKERDHQRYKSLALGRTHGIFGIGSAIIFKDQSSSTAGRLSEMGRYVYIDPKQIVAYGIFGTGSDKKSSFIKHEAGSGYFFIPQITLDEVEGTSVLAVQLAWNDASICTLEEALRAYDVCLLQAKQTCFIKSSGCSSKYISSTLRKFNMTEDKNIEMVCISPLELVRYSLGPCNFELKETSCCSRQFFMRLSPSLTIANDMSHYNNLNEVEYLMQKCDNINFLWASLIIEECSRLGLMYFCIAPGSRSSPLAIAASTHPTTTCISCIDERSLSFHAVGYGKGSHRPAVVITSSGTAVSNLYPAIVEASQEFVPLLVLTADRPPELQDVGANQAINQVNHYGRFVRHFFSFPTPSDEVSARMLLTTVDYAVHIATSSPCGPVHINCPFREPLDSSPKPWERSCLSGLNVWMSMAKPFTYYFQVQHPFDCSYVDSDMAEVLQVIQMAKKGLLLLGAIHGEDDVWAALLLAKHLSWPVVVDILSGLRLRKYIDHISEIDNEVLFIDHLDHLLLSDSVKDFMQADVIIQIGSRITSKRISEMLESCFPCSYIMVDKQQSRHDPMHIVTHRVQNIIHFSNYILKAFVPHTGNQWRRFLQTLNTMADWEISLQITSENSLTEPYVAHTILDAICCESAIFFGNSMPIRDADMYARNTPENYHNLAIKLGSRSCHYIQVGSNRGASGIDGLLSTAIGYAVGCNKRVISVLGDVSFLHDTNGLSLLRKQIPRKPMTILVINNHGGAIFSLLPVAANTERNILDQYFYTCHDVSVQNLCVAHGVKHVRVSTKMDLRDALLTSKSQNVDCVIEVNSSIEDNAHFHSTLRKFTRQAMNHAMDSLSRISIPDSIFNGSVLYEVGKMEYSLYRVQLCSPPTSASANNKSSAFFREGFIISLSLTDGSIGFGEVAPLEIHKENLFDVEEQLLFLTHTIGGVTIKQFLPLLNGLFSSWLWHNLGIPTGSIFPSVRCGLEMAVLNAIAASEGSSLLNILCPQTVEFPGSSLLDVRICALLDSNAPPEEIASIAADLVNEGFAALKLKVARHHDPNYDAAVIQEIRKKVGEEVEIRADANRNWSYEEAIQFAHSVKNCCLQYIEEPVENEDDIIRFYEATGLPVALDETINTDGENQFELLSKYTHPGIVAFVIKPSVIGGFENAELVARWAQLLGKNAVISATYETSLGLSAYVQLSYFIDLQNQDILRITNKEVRPSIAHGLGTYKWFKEDVSTQKLVTRRNSTNGFMGSPIADADRLLKEFQFNKSALVRDSAHVEVQTYQQKIYLDCVSISINVHEIGESENDTVLVFLHGFLGTGEDWIPFMKALSGSARCISIDLPGHGTSHFADWVGDDAMAESTFSIEAIAAILCNLFDYLHLKKVILVGYSMGARIALYMSLRCSAMIEAAVIVSGSPGLTDLAERKMRRAKDDFTASFLVSSGLESFLDIWYAGDLWNSLRCHPHFKKIVSSRLGHADLKTLARVLSDLSIGRQPSLWDDLKRCELPLLFIVGERDAKFKAIAQKMHDTITNQNASGVNWPEIVEIPYCGHAAHLENPLPVISAISRFLRKLKN